MLSRLSQSHVALLIQEKLEMRKEMDWESFPDSRIHGEGLRSLIVRSADSQPRVGFCDRQA